MRKGEEGLRIRDILGNFMSIQFLDLVHILPDHICKCGIIGQGSNGIMFPYLAYQVHDSRPGEGLDIDLGVSSSREGGERKISGATLPMRELRDKRSGM